LQRVYNFFVPRPLTTRPAQHLSDKIKPMAARVSVTGGALLLTHIALSAAEAPEPNYIVALGASGIHGKGVPLGEAYPAQLETMLRAAGFNVRVINAGVDGDTTAGMAQTLQIDRKGLTTSPQLWHKSTASRAPASQATSNRNAGRHHLGISGRLRRNLQRGLLSADQIALYEQLRGYSDSAAPSTHRHHG
jgi:hypothetical protein